MKSVFACKFVAGLVNVRIIEMKPKTNSAERMRRFRKKKHDEYPDYKSKESKRISALQKAKRSEMNKSELLLHKENNRRKVALCRARKQMEKGEKISVSTLCSSGKGFRSRQSLGKAVKKIAIALPYSPSKKADVVFQLASKIGFSIKKKKQEKSGNITSISTLTEDLKEKVKRFYYRPDIVYTAPGLRDEITVWTEAGKERMRKYYLNMHLKEAHAYFLEENPELKVGFSSFAMLRPANVVLLHNQPLDQCKCKVHENMRYKLQSLGIQVTKEQWDIILCNASGLEDSCWKGECDECKGGSKLKFSDKENNAEVTYHEWQDVTIQTCGKNRDKTYTSIENLLEQTTLVN